MISLLSVSVFIFHRYLNILKSRYIHCTDKNDSVNTTEKTWNFYIKKLVQARVLYSISELNSKLVEIKA